MPSDHEPAAGDRPRPVSPGAAARYWLRLGLVSFGGPAGQIAIMHHDLVEQRRWISEQRFLHALNYTMLLPGPEAQQLATYIGWLMHGTRGGIIAGALFVLPSLVLITALAWLYLAHHDLAVVSGAFYGVKPAVIAIIVAAAHRIGTRSLTTPFARIIAAGAFLALAVAHVPFPWVIGAAALAGLAAARLRPSWLATGATHGTSHAAYGPALIDDAMPVPPHARFAWPRLALIMMTGVVLWAGALGTLAWCFGWRADVTQMGWFFTKAALLTFGGAYAVLPYVYQGAVQQYGWLTATQMIDGLALGETTPGPLIMIVAFAGFIGGWNAVPAGLPGPLAGAMFAAVVATWFTFLPSFVFIFAGAPAVEATRHELRISAPLAAITAAVTGVILNLAVFFAGHVIWPRGLAAGADYGSLVLGLGCAVALFRYRVGVIPLIAAAATTGIALRLAGLAP